MKVNYWLKRTLGITKHAQKWDCDGNLISKSEKISRNEIARKDIMLVLQNIESAGSSASLSTFHVRRPNVGENFLFGAEAFTLYFVYKILEDIFTKYRNEIVIETWYQNQKKIFSKWDCDKKYYVGITKHRICRQQC